MRLPFSTYGGANRIAVLVELNAEGGVIPTHLARLEKYAAANLAANEDFEGAHIVGHSLTYTDIVLVRRKTHTHTHAHTRSIPCCCQAHVVLLCHYAGARDCICVVSAW